MFYFKKGQRGCSPESGNRLKNGECPKSGKSRIKLLCAGLFVLLLSAVSFTGYSGGGGKSSAAITMTTERGEVRFRMEGEGAAVIDWGEGSALETVTLSKRPRCEHAYTKKQSIVFLLTVTA